MNRSRFMKLAGILNESMNTNVTEKLGDTRRQSTTNQPMNEAGVNATMLNETISYFKEVKQLTNKICDGVLKELKKPTPDSGAAFDAFYTCLKLTQVDASFEPWWEWVVEGREYTTTPMFEKSSNFKGKGLREMIEYFEEIKRIINQICDISLKGLQAIKTKGNTATSADVSKIKKQIRPLLYELSSDIDASFERWENWCNNKVFSGITKA